MIAIVDYGMGNLASVQFALDHIGLPARTTADPDMLRAADGVVLPGVGAFGDAMDTLRRTGLVDAIVDVAHSGRPLLGVCLGMQLLLSESSEFGRHEGLGVVDGSVVPLRGRVDDQIKVPHMGWSPIVPAGYASWDNTPLRDIRPGTHLYFVHSFVAQLDRTEGIELSRTTYGGVEFCSSFQLGNVFGCQFHPERSGLLGVGIYRAAFGGRLDAPHGVRASDRMLP